MPDDAGTGHGELTAETAGVRTAGRRKGGLGTCSAFSRRGSFASSRRGGCLRLRLEEEGGK